MIVTQTPGQAPRLSSVVALGENMSETTVSLEGAVTLDTYTDAMGRTQHRATGPGGRVLITRANEREMWQVWYSDSLTNIARVHTLAVALERAVKAVERGE